MLRCLRMMGGRVMPNKWWDFLLRTNMPVTLLIYWYVQSRWHAEPVDTRSIDHRYVSWTKEKNQTTTGLDVSRFYPFFPKMALYAPRRSRSRTRPCFKRGSLWIRIASIEGFISVDGDSHMLQLSWMYRTTVFMSHQPEWKETLPPFRVWVFSEALIWWLLAVDLPSESSRRSATGSWVFKKKMVKKW